LGLLKGLGHRNEIVQSLSLSALKDSHRVSVASKQAAPGRSRCRKIINVSNAELQTYRYLYQKDKIPFHSS
jgi:hypothetical protein